MNTRTVGKVVLGAMLILFLSGCTGLGPHTIPRDRFDYARAISDSWKSQMLLNMVKLRYADVPVFVDVASVISQYTLEGQIELSAGWSNSDLVGDNQKIRAMEGIRIGPRLPILRWWERNSAEA